MESVRLLDDLFLSMLQIQVRASQEAWTVSGIAFVRRASADTPNTYTWIRTIYARTCVHAHIYIYIYIHIYKHTYYIYIYIYFYQDILCTYIYIVYIHASMCIYIYIYINNHVILYYIYIDREREINTVVHMRIRILVILYYM